MWPLYEDAWWHDENGGSEGGIGSILVGILFFVALYYIDKLIKSLKEKPEKHNNQLDEASKEQGNQDEHMPVEKSLEEPTIDDIYDYIKHKKR